MAGANEATPGGGWKTNVLRLPNGVCVVEFTGDNPPAADIKVAPHVGHGSLLVWNNTDGSNCGVYQNLGSSDSPDWAALSLTPTPDVLAALQGAMEADTLLVGQDGDPPESVPYPLVVDSAINTRGYLGVGNLNYDKTTNGTISLYGVSTVSRTVVGVVEVTEAFADGGDSQPIMKIGQEDGIEDYIPAAVFVNAPVGTRIPFVGNLNATKALLLTAVAAVGAGTGAIKIGWLLGKAD